MSKQSRQIAHIKRRMETNTTAEISAAVSPVAAEVNALQVVPGLDPNGPPQGLIQELTFGEEYAAAKNNPNGEDIMGMIDVLARWAGLTQ